MRRPQTVYFMQSLEGGPIKIGVAVDVEDRRRKLQTPGLRLKLLATMPGSYPEERALHARFAAYRQHKEWFAPAPELLAFIAELGGDVPPAELPLSPGYQGGVSKLAPFWTDERVTAALRVFVAEHGARHGEKSYQAAVRGDRRFPNHRRVKVFGGGSVAGALKRAVGDDAYVPFNLPWTATEEDRLLELAGTVPLATIAAELGRTKAACRRRLYELGTRARDAQGYLTAQQCARAYYTSIHRVLDLVRAGRLTAHKGPGGKYWQIDPESAARCPELRAPKRTYTTVPPDFGDYRSRYNVPRRANRDGRAAS